MLGVILPCYPLYFVRQSLTNSARPASQLALGIPFLHIQSCRIREGWDTILAQLYVGLGSKF